MAAVLYIASLLYKKDKISVGEITAFMFQMLMLVGNLGMVAGVFGNIAAVFGAADKVVEVMEYVPDIKSTGGKKLDPLFVNGKLEVKNVHFTYPTGSDQPVLRGVSLSVDNEKNRVVALCGTSGCGKSSIISLIERFYDPQEGEILFNGTDIKLLDPRWYHNQIGIVQQEPVLFAGTIRENILFGYDLDDCTPEQVEDFLDDACRQANAYEFIHDIELFPKGYDTMVGERGAKLSGGQK